MSRQEAERRVPRIPEKPYSFVGYVIRHCPPMVRQRAVISIISQIIAIIADVLVAWALGRIVGAIAAAGPEMWTNVLHNIGILCGLWFTRNAFFRLREYQDRQYIPVALNMARELLMNRLRRQGQGFLNSNFAGVLANHVRRASEVTGTLWDQILHSVIPLCTQFIGAGLLLWHVTPWMTAFLISFVVLGLLTSWWRAPIWTKLSQERAETMSALTGYIIDSTTNMTTVQQNVGWREESRRLNQAQDKTTGAYRRQSYFASLFWGGFDLVSTFFICGFMALVAYGFQQGSVTTAQLTMCSALVMQLFGSLAGTVRLLNTQFDDLGTLRDALHKIATPLSVMDAPNAQPLKTQNGRIEFRDVQFAYPQGKQLFKGLNLTIEPGQRVGLVGISGSGKTTICQLLLRAYDVDSGSILIDGQDIKEATLDSVRAAIAVIPQEPLLFHRTLGENILYGTDEKDNDVLHDAASAAQAHDFIQNLPEKYDTFVGERGVKLSGGQRQRIAIARAIAKRAQILIFDEATSALDSQTEKEIQDAMDLAMRGRTTLVIAHRLSTLAHLDRIIVMNSGQIMEDGTFETLREGNGIFAKLWNMQAGGFLPSAWNKSATWAVQ